MLCTKCSLKSFSNGHGKCSGCGNATYSRGFKYCGPCSTAKNVCAACSTPIQPPRHKLVEDLPDDFASSTDDILKSDLTE
ncbi:MAG: hypothetical protein WC028_24680 [Candidatus Obscuribacterales bacterium]